MRRVTVNLTRSLAKSMNFLGPPEPPAGAPNVSQNSGSSLCVTWCSAAYDGGCALTGYSVEIRSETESSWTTVAESCHSLSYTVRDLRQGEYYQFRVRAVNVHGASEPSAESEPMMMTGFEEGHENADDEEEFGKTEWEGNVIMT